MRLYQTISILIIILSFTSCEKLIEINLNEANQKIVIEANIHNKDDDCVVKISRTGNFFSTYEPEMISGAKIILQSDVSEYSFTEKEEGIYILNKTGNLDIASYKLIVEIEEEQYEAVSEMPKAINLKYLNNEFKEESFYHDAGYIVNFGFIDPADEENYYRVKYSVNGELQNDNDDYFLITDELFDGNSIQMRLSGNRFEKGDEITIELMSIDKNTYDYFYTFINILAQSTIESSAPTNPKSNFSNGALGYFSAYSSDIKVITIGNASKN